MANTKDLIKTILQGKLAQFLTKKKVELLEVDASADQFDTANTFHDSQEERALASMSFDKAFWIDSSNENGNVFPDTSSEEGKARVARLFIDDFDYASEEDAEADFNRIRKNRIKAKLSELAIQAISDKSDELMEGFTGFLAEARFKIVTRVRGGKVQRRKKVATQAGYTFRDGKLTRMKAAERMRRKIAQRKAAKKRVAKQSHRRREMTRSLRLRARSVPTHGAR